MSYNGSGTFLINTAGQPVVSGTVISSTAFNALTADLATGLSTAITKDGQTTVTANIPMANYKFTGLGAGSAAADSANLSQVQSTVVKLLASVSGTDTITAVGSPTVAAYAAGQMFYFVAAGDNTGAVTINIDSLGAKAVTRDGSVALAAGDIKSGEVVVIVYDGTRFQVVSQLNSSGDARFANVSIASALNVGGVATVTGGSVLNGGVVVNEPGADVDFRVESDTDANAFFLDGTNGNVGMGTSTPTDTGGFGRALDIQSSTGAQVIVRDSDDTTKFGRLSFEGGTANQLLLGAEGADTKVLFRAGAATRATLDASGNLGLGVTPSAWGSIFNAMQLGDGGFIAGRSDTATQLQLGCNGFYDGSNFKYIVTGTATRYYMDTGAHYWENAASGTAGNTISFTTAMVLDASGQLALGRTSVTDLAANVRTVDMDGTAGAGFRLRVNGTATLNFYALSSAVYMAAPANVPIIFETNNTERARIASGGQFSINTTNTSGILNVDGQLYLFNLASGAGNSTLKYNSGTGQVTYDTSSRLVKENIVDSTYGLAEVLQLKSRKYFRKDDQREEVGFVADEVQEVLPEFVPMAPKSVFTGNKEDTELVPSSVNYDKLTSVLVKAIQELKAELDATKAEVAALKGA